MKRHATNAMGSRASYKLVVQFISNSQLLSLSSHIINEAFSHNLIYTTMLFFIYVSIGVLRYVLSSKYYCMCKHYPKNFR